MILDANGNLYGETVVGGGTAYSGTIFELSPNGSGRWTETILHSFSGAPDGREPSGGLVFDSAGNLYGTTTYGGTGNAEGCVPELGCGTVFELSPGSSGWTESVLYNFTGGSDGNWPGCALIFDKAGNLYGTTSAGAGNVFELSPSSSGWVISVLFTFNTTDGQGQTPKAGLVMDSAGNLYGTTGFAAGGYGTVFELSPSSHLPWTETVLYLFSNTGNGSLPQAGLILDQFGDLYGTTWGELGPSTAFKLQRSSTGWTFVLLHDLPGQAFAPLIRDAAGNLYGTTQNGGQRAGSGTVFELSSVK